MMPAADIALRWAHGASAADLERLLEALHRVGGLLNRQTEVDPLLRTIIEESRHLVDAEASSLLLYDEAADDLYFHAALAESGDAEALRRSLRLKIGEGIAGTVAATRRTILVDDAALDPRVFRGADALTKFETRSILAAPMLDGERLVGVVEAVNKRDGAGFNEFDRRVLEMFGGLAALAISRARLIEENLRAAQLAAIGHAVTGLSHHTKNILMALGGSVELADEGIRAGNAQLLQGAWPVLKRGVKRLEHVVGDMLAYSKPRRPMLESCDPADLVDDAVDAFRATMAQRAVELTSDTSRAAASVRCDASALHHALLNLLSNAADVVPESGGRIHVEAARLPSGATEISVEDNGPGVAPADRARIFEPFYSSKGSKGTGLGLAVTAKILAEHGGSVRVETGRLGGCRFVLALPAGGNR